MTQENSVDDILASPVLVKPNSSPMSFDEFTAALPYVTITASLVAEEFRRMYPAYESCLSTRMYYRADFNYVEPYVHVENMSFRTLRTDNVKSFLRVTASSAITALQGKTGMYPCMKEEDLARIIRLLEFLCSGIVETSPAASKSMGVHANLIKSFCAQFSSFVLPDRNMRGSYDVIAVQRGEAGQWISRGACLSDIQKTGVNRLSNRDCTRIFTVAYNYYMIDFHHDGAGLWAGETPVSPRLAPYWDGTEKAAKELLSLGGRFV